MVMLFQKMRVMQDIGIDLDNLGFIYGTVVGELKADFLKLACSDIGNC